MQKQKCVFLDRDGVLNRELGDYTYKTEDFEVLPGVPEALALLKQNGYLLIVVTNQGGIAKGIYAKEHVQACHQKLQDTCNTLVDAIYFAPGHSSVSESLSRKPDSLMLEKAIAKYNIDPAASWLVGDAMRDMEAGIKAGVKTILVGTYNKPNSHEFQAKDLLEASKIILSGASKLA